MPHWSISSINSEKLLTRLHVNCADMSNAALTLKDSFNLPIYLVFGQLDVPSSLIFSL